MDKLSIPSYWGEPLSLTVNELTLDAMPDQELNRLAILLTEPQAHTVFINETVGVANEWSTPGIKPPAPLLQNHDKTDAASGVI